MSSYKSSIHKYGNNLYRVDYSYKTPDGKRHRSCKRGFKLQREATAWQRNELPALIEKLESDKPNERKKEDMLFSELIEEYMKRYALRRKETTCATKGHIITTKILPYFKDVKVFDITVADVESWQDMLLASRTSRGKPLSPTYIRTIRSQFTAIMNYAVKLHGLPFNPLDRAEMIGKKNAEEQPFWQLEDYKAFRLAIADKPMFFYAFEVLFWTGMRMGEMLALTPSDIDFEKLTITVDETYTRLHKKNLLTDPKNESSKRDIDIPQMLANELQEYITSLYGVSSNTRIFPLTKSGLHHELDRGIAATGITDVTVHGIRHSHISLCASSKINAREVAIARRVGHSKNTMTSRYTHAYKEDLVAIATKLNELMEEMDNVS